MDRTKILLPSGLPIFFRVEVYVYNWGEYIDERVIDVFEKDTGIKVYYNYFEENEDMYPIVANHQDFLGILLVKQHPPTVNRFLHHGFIVEDADRAPTVRHTVEVARIKIFCAL